MGKEEIAHDEQFLLFSQCFENDFVLQTCTNKRLFGKELRVKTFRKTEIWEYLKREKTKNIKKPKRDFPKCLQEFCYRPLS